MTFTELNTFLFSSKGRVSRMQYNVHFMVPFMAVNVLLYVAPMWFQGDLELMFKVSLVISILSLVILWPFMALTNKRFHDRNASGWRQFTYVMISVVGGIVAFQGIDFGINPTAMVITHTITNQLLAIAGVGLVILPMIAMVIDLCVLKGTTGTNKYGSDPLAM